MSSPAIIPRELAELFESGVSILVGTRSASRLPEATRGVGAIVHPNRRQLTVFLPIDVAGRALENLRDNAMIAVGFSAVLDHTTTQVKGRVVEIRDATEAEREIVTRYRVAFGEVLSLTGIPRATTRRLTVWPSAAVTFEATDIFEQTPGPGAGERLKSP